MVCPRAGEEGDHRDMTGISIRQLSGSTGIDKTIIERTAKAHKTEEASPRLTETGWRLHCAVPGDLIINDKGGDP